MRRFSLGAIAFAIAFPVVSLAAQKVAAAPGAAPTKAPQPADNPKKVVKLVRPQGAYADLPAESFDPLTLLTGGSGKQKPFYDLIRRVEALAADDQADLVFFDLSRPVALNGAQLAELERAMKKVRAAGKKCHAYLENAGSTQLQIAALCDKVHLAEMAAVDFGSLALSVTFLRDALDLLGVRMDVVRCGDFKGAVEPFLLPRMSDHLREHYRAMLEHMNADVVRRVAQARGLDAGAVRALQGKRLLRAEDALQAGLVDRLVPWDGADKTLKRIVGTAEFEVVDALRDKEKKKSLNFLSLMNSLLSRKKEQDDEPEKAAIAVLHLSGGIVDGHQDSPGSMVSGPTVAAIEKLIENDKVKAVVARVNSPGGSATASEAIRRALERLAAKKPLVYSMGRVAASGGYWITCVGRPILAEATTITGSIGVFGMKPNLGTLMRRIGVHEELVALDASASMDSLAQGWADAEKARMQSFVDGIYDRFLNLAAKSRKMARADVEAIAGGRVWSGEQARSRGLIDAIGGLEQAVAMVAAEAQLEDYELLHTPRSKSFMDAFVEQLFGAEDLLGKGVTRLALRRLGNLDAVLAVLLDAFHNDGPPRVWAMMPFDVRIQ